MADDIRAGAAQHLFLDAQIDTLDARIANLAAERDPQQILQSAPGMGPVVAGIIAGRIGDPARFTSLAAVRKFAGLVPNVASSGTQTATGQLTKRGDALLRHGSFIAADSARRTDPQLVAKYVRLMEQGRHHTDAIIHLAATLLTRVVACWRAGTPYIIWDLDGTVITAATLKGRRSEQRTGRAKPKSPSDRWNATYKHIATSEAGCPITPLDWMLSTTQCSRRLELPWLTARLQ